MKFAPGYYTQCSKYTSGNIKPGVASIFLLAASAMACTPAMAQDEPAAASSEYQASIVAAMDKAAYLALAKKTDARNCYRCFEKRKTGCRAGLWIG